MGTPRAAAQPGSHATMKPANFFMHSPRLLGTAFRARRTPTPPARLRPPFEDPSDLLPRTPAGADRQKSSSSSRQAEVSSVIAIKQTVHTTN